MEAVNTNVIGTDNVLTAAIEADVKAVICLSTDKAAYPINAMGITKAIEEKSQWQSLVIQEILKFVAHAMAM